MEDYLGSIRAFAFNFAPSGYAFCNGGLLPINQYSALFALLGTAYGGDGVSTFGLPNLQGRTAVGQGQLNGGSSYTLGQVGGTEQTTISASQMPMHNHLATSTLYGEGDLGTLLGPAGHLLAGATANIYAAPSSSANQAFSSEAITTTIQPAGGSQPLGILSPFQVVNYCICTQGLYPSRN